MIDLHDGGGETGARGKRGRSEGGKGTYGEKGRLPGVVPLQDEAEKRAAGLSGTNQKL